MKDIERLCTDYTMKMRCACLCERERLGERERERERVLEFEVFGQKHRQYCWNCRKNN